MHRLATLFGCESTANDVIRGVDRTGKRAVVTGAASGLVWRTPAQLAAAGAEVVLGLRRLDAGQKVAEERRQATGNEASGHAGTDHSGAVSGVDTTFHQAARSAPSAVRMSITGFTIFASRVNMSIAMQRASASS